MSFHLILVSVNRLKYIISSANRLLLFIFLNAVLIIPDVAWATTYYVDATVGKDVNNGITIATPWKTIGKVNGMTFKPGDSILFKRGEIWREQLTIPSSGATDNPIIFGAYGAGDKPLISGADEVRNWAVYNGHINMATIGDIASPSQLYVDGQFYDIAHHPNSGYLLATADSSDKASIIDSSLNLSTSQVVGATVNARTVPWWISTSKVASYNYLTNTISLNSPVAFSPMSTGFGFYLLNMFWMLDSPGEWFHDPSNGKIYLWTATGDSPNGHTVEVSNRSYGIIGYNKNNVVIRDMAINKANKADVHFWNSENITLKNLDITGGQLGINLSGAINSQITNNSIQNTISNGIQVAERSNNIEVSNNTVLNAGSVGLSPKQSNGGILVSGTTININNNTIINSGYNGIIFFGNLITIQNNVIDKSCLVLDDCAGIYTGLTGTASNNNTIIGNTISNSIGSLSGTPKTSSQAHGIYLDDGTHDTNVLNNIIFNTYYGIFIHTGNTNNVSGNTVYSVRRNGLLINESGVAATSPGVVHDNFVTDNIFETISSDATAYYYSSIKTATNFGTYNNNHYYHPNSDFVIREQNIKHKLLTWQQSSGQDLKSTDSKSVYTPPKPTLSLTATPSLSGSYILSWSSANAISCVAGGAWSGAKPASSSLTVNNSGTYTLSCSGRGGAATQSVTVNIPTSVYEPAGVNAPSKVNAPTGLNIKLQLSKNLF